MRQDQRRSGSGTGFGGQQPKAVHKALAMLEAVAHLGAGATAKQIAGHTGVPPATAYRMLNYLVAEGFLVRVPDLTGFALGQRTSELAHAASTSTTVEGVGDVLEAMRSETRHGLYLATFRDGSLRVVDSDPDHEGVAPSTIMRNPHAHAIGKLLLAYQPQKIRSVQLRAVTSHTLVDGEALQQDLARVLATELASENEESRLGRAALAVPIRERSSHVIGGLCLQGAAHRVSPNSTELVEFLKEGARALRGLL
ncbi:IclR family transcriptional regulator [Williamsia sp. D3]|uniref:IclR family transcriptional regulator n=1 Tax=Williamsia sp. D3 TaxID=1313067 RepID=UPI0003D2C7F4|nr:IclR family transcriptional regulator C-terminal domain-containing protein [Williamsia sp. D3]ETD33993.1 IclR family transcriptional regulator [Williamsia sp. D3]